MQSILNIENLGHLTQRELYYLFDNYGGYLDTRSIGIIDSVFRVMHGEEQQLIEIKSELTGRQRAAARAIILDLINRYRRGQATAPPDPEKLIPPPRRGSRQRNHNTKRREAQRITKEALRKRKQQRE